MGGASLGGRAVLPRGLLASEGAPLPEVGAMRVLPWGSVSTGHGAVGTGSGWPAVLGDASSLGCSVVGGWGGAGGVFSHQGGTLSAEGATAAGMGDTGCPGGVTAAGTGQSCPGGGVAIGEGATAGRTGRSHCGGLSPCTVSPSGGGSTLSPIGDGVFPDRRVRTRFSQQLPALQGDPSAERSSLRAQPKAAASPRTSDARGPRCGAAVRCSDAWRCCGWGSSGWDADKMSAAL